MFRIVINFEVDGLRREIYDVCNTLQRYRNSMTYMEVSDMGGDVYGSCKIGLLISERLFKVILFLLKQAEREHML